MMRIGSLFSGYSGLDLAVREVLGGEVVWHAEHEPPTESNPNPTQAAARLLAYHYPHLPNLGDITAIDWDTVPPVEVLTGGFPCQDVSSAGRRRGLRPGSRSGLWQHMAYAIDRLRPRLVVIENVRGLLSADAHCDLEPCPWCLGDDEGRPLRALGAVLGDLADIGYDAQWVGLPASDVGAPHGRFRVFVLAWPRAAADPGGGELQRRRVSGVVAGPKGTRTGERAEWERDRDPARDGREDAADAERDGWTGRDSGGAGTPDSRRDGPRPSTAGCGADAAADPDGIGPVRGGNPRGRRTGSTDDGLAAADAMRCGRETGPTVGKRSSEPFGDDAVRAGRVAADPDGPGPQGGRLRRRPGTTVVGDGASTTADPDRDGPEGRPERDLRSEAGQSAPHGGDPAGRVLDWGDYGPAIRRWELILGRPAPAPTMTGVRGGQQLSPAFVEWMMGLEHGWVTDVPGLTRSDQLKMLGNGVVPQQAAEALRRLLTIG